MEASCQCSIAWSGSCQNSKTAVQFTLSLSDYRQSNSGEIKVEESRNLICQLTGIHLHTTIIIDALDRCEEVSRSELIEVLDWIVQEAKNPVKILVSSRPEKDIKPRFERGPNIGIRITDNKGDIAKFVTSEIQSWSTRWWHKVSSTLKDEICETLVEKSQGM